MNKMEIEFENRLRKPLLLGSGTSNAKKELSCLFSLPVVCPLTAILSDD